MKQLAFNYIGLQARIQKCGLGGRVPKALEWRRRRRRRGWGLVSLSPSGGGVWGGGCAPSPEKFWHFLLRNGAF